MDKKAATAATMILVFLTSLASGTAAYAQQIPTPSTPEFTLKVVSNPYDVPPTTTNTTTVDPYTGNTTVTVITQPGYLVENRTIEVIIKNQPYDYSFNGTTYQIFYDVRTKGHFEEDWTDVYPLVQYFATQNLDKSTYVTGPRQSNTEYTVLTFSADSPPNAEYPPTTYPPDAQVDFQVEAIVGHNSQYWVGDHPLYPQISGHYDSAVGFDTNSSWSPTQTITIPAPSASASASPTPSPSQISSPSSTAPTTTLTLTPTEPSTPTTSPFTTLTPTQVIIQSVPTWFYIIISALVAVIAVLLGVIVSMQRRKTIQVRG